MKTLILAFALLLSSVAIADDLQSFVGTVAASSNPAYIATATVGTQTYNLVAIGDMATKVHRRIGKTVTIRGILNGAELTVKAIETNP